MGTKYHGLKRNKKPRPISKKKLASLPQEKEERAKVKKRANGKCEICGEKPCAPTYQISCHELVFRSAGGKVSEDGSVGVCDLCHYIFQHYLILHKGQCIRIIIQTRHVDVTKAYEIYNKILKFAQEHDLIRESKLK